MACKEISSMRSRSRDDSPDLSQPFSLVLLRATKQIKHGIGTIIEVVVDSVDHLPE
jgi:hypothetical protein